MKRNRIQCGECGEEFNAKDGELVLGSDGKANVFACRGCAAESKARSQDLKPAVLVDDDCANCGQGIKVVVKTWTFMESFWGRVICANLCEECELNRDHDSGRIYNTISRRQARARRAGA